MLQILISIYYLYFKLRHDGAKHYWHFRERFVFTTPLSLQGVANAMPDLAG